LVVASALSITSAKLTPVYGTSTTPAPFWTHSITPEVSLDAVDFDTMVTDQRIIRVSLVVGSKSRGRKSCSANATLRRSVNLQPRLRPWATERNDVHHKFCATDDAGTPSWIARNELARTLNLSRPRRPFDRAGCVVISHGLSIVCSWPVNRERWDQVPRPQVLWRPCSASVSSCGVTAPDSKRSFARPSAPSACHRQRRSSRRPTARSVAAAGPWRERYEPWRVCNRPLPPRRPQLLWQRKPEARRRSLLS